jgi:hypothetical protein
VEAIVKNYLPFQIVESHHFQEFVHKLTGAYKMPTRKTVSDVLLHQMYNMTKEKAKHSLESTDAATITMDGGLQLGTRVTANYINSDMELKSSLLDCFKHGENHTAINLAEEIKRLTC